MKTKKAFYYLILAMSVSFCFTACSSDDESDKPVKEVVTDPSIIGAWELKTLILPDPELDYIREMPSDKRDIYMFNSDGKVKVIVKKGNLNPHPDLPNEDGEYDYSYEKEKQILQLCGEALKCSISNGEMHIKSNWHSPSDGYEVEEYIFVKRPSATGKE